MKLEKVKEQLKDYLVKEGFYKIGELKLTINSGERNISIYQKMPKQFLKINLKDIKKIYIEDSIEIKLTIMCYKSIHTYVSWNGGCEDA